MIQKLGSYSLVNSILQDDVTSRRLDQFNSSGAISSADLFGEQKQTSGENVWDHSFNTYRKLFEKLTFLTPLILACTYAYQELRNDSFCIRFCVLTK